MGAWSVTSVRSSIGDTLSFSAQGGWDRRESRSGTFVEDVLVEVAGRWKSRSTDDIVSFTGTRINAAIAS